MMDENSATPQQWLTLSAAAERVGVHASTLRDWSMRGLVPHLRTPGGHRRYTEKDLQAFINNRSQGGALVVLEPPIREIEARAIRQIRGNTPSSAPWHAAFDRDAIERQREQGRRLLGLALRYVARQTNREAIMAEAEEIGEMYGRDAAMRQIALAETARAFAFFSDSLVRAARPVAPSERNDEADDQINQDLRAFLDAVNYAMLAAFEAQLRHQLLDPAHMPAP